LTRYFFSASKAIDPNAQRNVFQRNAIILLQISLPFKKSAPVLILKMVALAIMESNNERIGLAVP
jgi:hypothetical protein